MVVGIHAVVYITLCSQEYYAVRSRRDIDLPLHAYGLCALLAF